MTTMLTEINDLKKQLNSTVAADAAHAEKEAAALADGGDLSAAEMLASVYASGAAAIRADRIKEFKYTRIAADLGSAFHRYWLAHLQRDAGDFTGALANARLAHDMDQGGATTLLAQMMLAGEGEPARPLDALQLLSDSVERGSNSDAALLLAEVQLEGKFIPRNAQGAYDMLQRYASMFDVLRHVTPVAHARYLYLKAEALRLGATASGGETYAGLVGQAADCGNGAAIAARRDMEGDAAARERNAEWEAFCSFTAYSGKWKMFANTGVLVGIAKKSHTTTSGINGNISSSTSYWKVATFKAENGHQFTVSLPGNPSLVTGRSYAALYVGPANDDSGVPMALFDLQDGSVSKTTNHFAEDYPKNCARIRWRLSYLLVGFFGLMPALGLFAASTFFGLVAVGAVGTLFWKMNKAKLGGYKAALEQAGRFFGKHRKQMA